MRLLAVNLNYLGDALFTTPALARLRARFPNAHIDVLAGARAAALLQGNPHIDGILLRPPHGGVGRATALIRVLREGRYDAVYLFQSTLSNAMIAWAAGVPVRIGFGYERCERFLTHMVPTRTQGEHVVDTYLRIVEAWDGGAKADPAADALPMPDLSVAISDEELAFADRFFESHEMIPPVVGLVIGATRPQKRWPEEYFARLADKLWNVAGVSSVLLGGPEETDLARGILARAESPLVSAVGQTSERELAAVIARLSVVVSGDTGPLHIATAMKTPVVALFGSTDPGDTGPWLPKDAGDEQRRRAVVLYDRFACAPCLKTPTCDGRFDCLRALTPERVFDAVSGLLQVPTRRTALPMAAAPLPVAGLAEAAVTVAPSTFATSPVSAPAAAAAAAPPSTENAAAREPRSVLVLTKHRFMGDAIVAVPLLRALRRVYPRASVTLATGAPAATVLQNCPYVDHILAYDPKAAERTTAGSARLSAILVREMLRIRHQYRPDLCLIVDRSFRAAAAALLAGARDRVGFDSEGRSCLLTHPVHYELDRHETECCLDILRAVRPEPPNEPPYDPRPELWTTECERARGAEILRAAGAPLGEAGVPLVGIQPGASHDYKQWRPERFAEVANRLAGEFGAALVLVGRGETELEAARRMRAALAADVPVIDLTDRTGLRETMGVLTHLSLFVGNDTGVNHIAAAVGTPTVALFGPTPAQKWGNVGPRNVVLVAENGVMDNIAVTPVLDAARAILVSGIAQPAPPLPAAAAGGAGRR